MYSTCLHCHRSLGVNEAVEHFPVGRRLAFDSAKGRLWVVCPECGRWNLTPIEERWEAVEDCERLFEREPLRAQTDHVGLAQLREGVDLIRIGAPRRPEFAAWRYGGVFGKRLRTRTLAVAGGGVLAGAGLVAASGALAAAAQIVALAPVAILPLVHLVIVPAIVNRGALVQATVIGGDGKPLRVTGQNLEHTHIIADGGDPIELRLRHSYGHQTLVGDRATRALSTLLAHANRRGGMSGTIRSAAELIADAGGPRAAITRIARESERRAEGYEELAAAIARGPRGRTIEAAAASQYELSRRAHTIFNGALPTNRGALHHLPAALRFALEMSLHESSEQFAREQELSLLARDWREAEEIAAISDGLLTPSRDVAGKDRSTTC
jgi:hypothetical protein